MSAGERVLVVEDDDDIREILQYLLTLRGFHVDVARDGLDALSKLESNERPPLILLDMMMPNMDGETFLRAIRGRPALRGARVIVISGDALEIEKGRKLEAVEGFLKPFEVGELLGAVLRYTSPEGP